MGFFNATNPLTGEIISHQIEGDTPTEEEALEIEQYMALFNKKAIPDNVPDDEGNLFTKGVARGVDTLQMMYGSAIEGLGETFDSDLLKDYGAEVVEKNKEELQSNIEYAKRLDDIKGAGSFFDWTASTLGEQVPQLGSTLAGAGAGAVTGSFFGPVGTVVGSVIGGISANLPFFYGGNREAQKEEIAAGNRIEISEGAAALTAIPQSALDFIADRFLVGGFTGKALAGGGIFTRGVKGISIGAVTEVPTEIGQQVLERFQAGKDLLSEEAMNEYYEVAAAAALVGGTVRGTGTIIGGDKAKAEDKAKSTEQDEDLRTEIQSAKVMADNATNFINQEKNLEDLKNPNGTNLTLSQLPEHIKQEVMDNRPDVVVTDETLTQDDLDVVLNRINDNDADTKDTKYNKVKDAVKNKGQYTHAIAKEALKTKKTQTIKQSTLNRIRDKLLTNNVIKKEGAKLVPATTSEQDLKLKAEQIKAKAKEIVKNLEILNKQKEQRTTLEDPSLEDVKAIDDIDNTIGQLQEDYSKVEKIANNIVTESERKLGKDAIRLAQILPPIDAKQAFDNANALKKEYIASKNKIIKNLRKKLNNIGLKDVKLEGQDIISLGKLSPEETIEKGAIPEGSYGNRVIALAMKIYDPSLSDADIEKKLASVMNHEIIHALKDLNLFTQKEYETLVNAANKRKYVVMHDGKPVERKYTYMERAARLYGNLDSEAQAEEAVAELYRDWADGKLKLGGKPKTVFQKIVAFVKSIFQSHSEAGFKDADSIFQNLKTIGRRERDVNSNIKSEKKGSIAGIVAGYIEPEKGNVDRIAKDFKQVTKRVPELQKAAQELQDGKIDYKEYDKRVNKFKPILPYTTVPLPATTSEMRGALTKNKQDKLNKINEVPDGTTVRLRLDIPAYTGSGVWIPTIHDSSNKVLSHESVVIVNNAALEPTVGAQRIGLRIATGAQKGPFATIEGSLEKTTPEAALAEAQAAINDPSFVQVGFDPERHSYFYDRTTTQSVIGADRIIQVGPLVMAKNPVFGRKQDYKYSVIGFDKPQSLDNRLLGIIRDNPDGFTVDPDSLESMSSGIAVAPVKAAEIKVKPNDLNEETLYQFAENLYIMSQLSGTKIFAGGWTGPDGMFYLDATMLVDDFNDALYIGEAAEQEGIFNLNNFEYTDTSDGIKRLQETNTYNGKRRAERQRNIRKLTEEFKKTRYQRQAEQKSKVSSPTRIEAGQERDIKEQVGYYPTVDNNGFTTLTHYSSIPNITVISPDKQGTNFNIRGQETLRRRIFSDRYVPRNYYGLNVKENGGYRKETGLGDNTYEGIIEVNRLYPLDADPNGYLVEAAEQAQEEERGGPDTGKLTATLLEKRIRDEGFVGYWTGQQLGMVAAVFDPVPVLPEGETKFSVRGVNPEQLSIVDMMNPDGTFEQLEPPNTVKITEAVKKEMTRRGNVTLDIKNPEEKELAIQTMLLELKANINADDSAIGWYKETLQNAKKLYANVYPEIFTDKNAESAFDFILAISSNGTSVINQNIDLAKQFENWQETGLLLEEKGIGEQGVAQVKAYQVYNLLKTKLGKTDLQIKEFFSKTLLVKDINNIPFLKEANVTIATETVNAELPVSYILGSKIGAFYQNIIGDYSHLTMDRWYMRFYNRVTGDPFVRVQDKTLVKNRRKVQEETSIALAQGTDDEKSRITAAMNEAGIDNLTDATVTDFATAITIKYQQDFNYNRRKNLPAPPKTTFIKEAENLFRNTSELLQEVPRTKQAREDIRDIFKEVVTRYNRDTDKPITIADAQAVQWYAEKRFFHAMGVRKGVGNDNDYIDAAISFLRKRGINDETIGQTLPESIRIRLNDKRNTREQSVTITGEARQNVGYEKRRLTKDELDGYDALEGVLEQDINNANELVDNARYSLIGVPKPITDTYFKADSPLARVAYGAIQAEDRGPRNIIFYTTGEHAEKAVGTNDFDQPILEYRGFGKSHIDAPRDKLNRFNKAIGKQSHAEELMEIFDYNSVEDLLFQSFVLLQNQQLKGINNGIKIISDVGQGDIRLEFNKAPLKNKDAKQVKLVIPLKFVKRGNSIDPAVEFRAKSDTFVVRTAYAAEKKYSVVGATMDNMQSTPTSDAIVQGAQDTKDYMIYDNLSKVLAKAGKFLTVGQVEEQTLRKKAQDFLIKFQDRMLPIGELVDNLRAMGLKITEAMDTYMQEEVFHGRAGAKIDAAQKKLFTPMVNIINSLNIDATKLNELKQNTKSKQGNGFFEQASDNYENEKLALADTVLYAFHAKERNNRLNNPKGAGMGNAEAQAVIDWIGSLDQTNQDKIFQIRQSARDIVANTNKERRDGGLIPRLFTDPVTGKEYDKIYDDYVPLRGDMDAIQEDEADFSGNPVRQIKNLFGAIGRQDKKAKGRTKKDIDNFYARDITANLFYQNQKSINTGERNKVGLSFLRLVRGQEEGATEVNVNLQKAMQEHANVYFNLKDAKADGYTTRDEIGKEVVDRSRVLTVRENGQDVYIAMKDQRIARAMKGFMSPDSVGSFTRALGKLNRYLSNINTSYNPEFMITNFTRDLGTAGVNLQQFGGEKGFTREVLKGAFSAVNGIRKVLRNDDTSSYWAKKYEEFVNAGGRNATNQMSDLQDQMNNLQSVIGDIGSDSKKGLFGKAKNGVKKVGQFLDDYNTAVENGVRVATYDALIKRGFSPTRAAQAARNVTVNFAKGGEQKQFLNSWYLFYNASLQGSMAIINAAIRSPRVRKVWGGLIVFGVLSDYFAEAMSGDEDEDGVKDYDELPRYILEHNLIFPTFGLSEDKFIKIPLPYGLNIATNFGRSLARASRGEYTVGQASRSIFGTAFESLSPFGGFDNFYNFASPTFADPFVSVAINEDYKGDPIFKETPQFSSRPTPESYLHWSSTSTVAKTIAESVNDLTGGDNFKSGLLDFSPDVLEFWFDYITGGAGRFVQRSLEAPFDIVDVMNEDFRGDITQKLPFIRRVLQSPSEREDTATYLENRKEVFTLFARLDLARRSGDSEAINELLRNNREQIAIIPRLKAVDNARNRLQRQIREIERNPRLNEELKKRLIKLRRDRINDLMRRGLILMRSVGYKETG